MVEDKVEDQHALFRRADDVEEMVFGRRVALYRSGSEQVIISNPTGSLIWKRLETPHSLQSLVEYLQAQFPAVEREQLGHDALNYLRELKNAGCVEGVDESSGRKS